LTKTFRTKSEDEKADPLEPDRAIEAPLSVHTEITRKPVGGRKRSCP
jgi:hypothetical protein